MAKFCFTDLDHALGQSICKSAGVDPNSVRRIVLDLKVGEPGHLYLETYADDAVLGVKLPAGIEITADD
jgi:hypothetical protein